MRTYALFGLLSQPGAGPVAALLLALCVCGALLPIALLPACAPAYGWEGPAHVAAFCLLALPAALSGPRPLRLALPALALVGAGIELLQGLTGRHPSFSDAGMNLLGLLIGALLGLLARRIFRAGGAA